MAKRIAAIAFIFVCTSIAWIFLGGTITARTQSAGEKLRGRVQSVWGAPQEQTAPIAEYDEDVPYSETITEDGHSRVIQKTRQETRGIRPQGSDLSVELHSEPRRKGLLCTQPTKWLFAATMISGTLPEPLKIFDSP